MTPLRLLLLVSISDGQVKDRSRGAESQLRGRIAALEAECAFLEAQNRQLWVLAQEGAQARLALEGVLVERDRLAAKVEALGPEHRGLASANARLVTQNAELQGEVARLRELVETLSRAAHRQSAPFSRNDHKAHPRRPGRRAGPSYGTRAHRAIPERIDDDVVVPHPRFCPDCGGELVADGEDCVYEQEIPPVAVLNRRYRMCRGRCRSCNKVSRGRHPTQSSVALGAAACHLGPRAVALAVVLNKECGVSATKIARLFRLFGLSITSGGVVGVCHRAAHAALDQGLTPRSTMRS